MYNISKINNFCVFCFCIKMFIFPTQQNWLRTVRNKHFFLCDVSDQLKQQRTACHTTADNQFFEDGSALRFNVICLNMNGSWEWSSADWLIWLKMGVADYDWLFYLPDQWSLWVRNTVHTLLRPSIVPIPTHYCPMTIFDRPNEYL